MSDSTERAGGKAPGRETELQRSIKLFGNQSLPIEVGRLEVDGEGFLQAREGDRPLAFHFSFRGFDFDALVNGGEAGLVQLKAALGQMPFTAESAAGRRLVRSLIAMAGSLHRGRLALSERGEITFEAATVPPTPRTPISIMASVAALLLEAKPHLELLADALGVEGPPQPARR